MVHFIHAAIYDLATETCGKTHFKVDLSFPGGTSQVCSEDQGLEVTAGEDTLTGCALHLSRRQVTSYKSWRKKLKKKKLEEEI